MQGLGGKLRGQNDIPIIIGLDFGNINSYPAYVSGIDPNTHWGGVEIELVPAECNKIGIPSCFHIDDRQNVTYGISAVKRAPSMNRRNLLKRRMGESEYIAGVNINYDDVITGVLKHVVDVANGELRSKNLPLTNRVSLAFPVDFDIDKKIYLKELAEKAELEMGENIEVVGMIQEPAAAALEYLGTLPPTENAQDYTVLVYDLGGGTFDASIVSAHQDENGVFTSYNVHDQKGVSCAGNEFTEKLLELIKIGITDLDEAIPNSDFLNDRMKRRAEEMKIDLSRDQSVQYETENGSIVEITRQEFETATNDLVMNTINVTRDLYDRCPVKPDRIVMTGGQSGMPIIKEKLIDKFRGCIQSDSINQYKPQQAIAFGAARFGTLNCENKQDQDDENDGMHNANAVVRLRTGRMLGLAYVQDDNGRNHVDCLIERNSEIPLTNPVIRGYYNTHPATSHTIFLYEALTETPDIYNRNDFHEVGRLKINFGIDEPAQVAFNVEVTIDRSNQIHFTAKDPRGLYDTVTIELKLASYV